MFAEVAMSIHMQNRTAVRACAALAAAAGFALAAQAQELPPRANVLPAHRPADLSAADGGAGGMRPQLVAVRRAVVSSEMTGKIANMPFREGQAFHQGDTLVAYDCAFNRARLERAIQSESAAGKKLAVSEQLDKLNSISRSDVEQARAAVAVARAETSVERVMVNRCTITAPYPGRVGETYVRPSESVAEGKELISIYDDNAFEVETIVPSRWLTWLNSGYPMRIAVDETGRTYDAVVSHIAGAVDPVSQSVKVIGRLAGGKISGGADLLPGMSGSVRIDPPAATQP